MTVVLKFAVVEYTDFGCASYFADGSVWGATPHQERHYYVIAHRLGYGDDVMRYCREHEVAHHLLAEYLFDAPSPVIWALAHGDDITPGAAAIEELGVHALQRWARANERPIVGGIDWDSLRDRFLEAAGEAEVLI